MITNLDPSSQIDFYLTLYRKNHSNGMSLQQYADAVIAGSHPVLGHSEFYKEFGIDPVNISTLTTWANSESINVIDDGSTTGLTHLSATAATVNRVFGITLQQVQDSTRTYQTHQGSIVIPAVLSAIVETVSGLDQKSQFKHNANIVDPKEINAATNQPYAVTSVTPAQASTSYNFPSSDGYGQSVAIVEFGGGYTIGNLTTTFNNAGLPVPTIVDVSVLGATNNPTDYTYNGEVMLDIFVVGGSVNRSRLVMYFCPNNVTNYPNVINAIINDTTNMPSVVSISYGSDELAYTGADTNMQSAVVLGITIVVSSGDYGSTVDGTSSTLGHVNYPASSPYALGVGGTTINTSNGTLLSESVWNQGNAASGGGISSVESLPSYQSGLTYTQTNQGATSLTTRGIPDVAANGDPASGYLVFYNNSTGTQVEGQIGGTSAAAPLWAALIARLNQLTGYRQGLIHSKLYANTSVLNDISSGNNQLSVTGVTYGFVATAGWDAVTGLGSPNGPKIYKLLHTGSTWPKQNYGFRPTTGSSYPRIRQVNQR